MKKKIVVIPGDGIGGEITDAAVKVLKKTAAIYHLDLSLDQKMAGGTAYDACGDPLPKETVEAAQNADAVLFGAVGGDKWDNVDPLKRPEKAVLGLRRALCQPASRPCLPCPCALFALEARYRDGHGCPHRARTHWRHLFW